MNYRLFALVGLFLFAFNEFLVSEAFAYIDPGTGSMVVQVLIGAFVGVGVAIKVYWYKLKEKLIRKKE